MISLESCEKCGEVRIGKLAMNLVGGLLVFGLLAILAPLAMRGSYRQGPAPWEVPLFLVLLIPLVVLHECLHGYAALRWGGIRPGDLKFGVMWKAGALYCNCTMPITVWAYRRVTLLPFHVTGALTLASLVIQPALWTALLASVALAACVGDLWVFAKLRRFRADQYVMDHPTEIGCDIYEEKATVAAQPDSGTCIKPDRDESEKFSEETD